MPLYIVRWPDLSAALVKARDEEDLIEILDQVANPEGCTWSVYRGPIFLEFAPPAEYHVERGDDNDAPLRPDQVIVDDVGEILNRHLVASSGDCEEGMEMELAIMARVFPNIHRALTEGDDEPDEGMLRKAVHADLAPLCRSSWRNAAPGKDLDVDALIARELDMPLSLLKRLKEHVKGPAPPDVGAKAPPAGKPRVRPFRKPRRDS